MAPKRRKAPAQQNRNDQVLRVLSVLQDINRLGGADLYELAGRYDTNIRTIRRDLEALEAAGFPLTQEDSPDSSRKRWSVDLRALKGLGKMLDVSHYLALRLAMGQGGPVGNKSALFAALEALGTRIEEALGSAGRKQLADIERCVFSWEKFAWRKAAPELLWPLVTAVSENQLCVVQYRAPHATEDKRFKVLPLKVFVHEGAMYLHAWNPKFKSLTTLNLQRLVKLELLKETAPTPKEYRADELEASAFGIFTGPNLANYRLRFSKDVAPFVLEREWHSTQKVKELKDGVVELTFRCPESFEVGKWVGSWRSSVEVLEPASLRKQMAEVGEWMRGTYGK